MRLSGGVLERRTDNPLALRAASFAKGEFGGLRAPASILFLFLDAIDHFGGVR